MSNKCIQEFVYNLRHTNANRSLGVISLGHIHPTNSNQPLGSFINHEDNTGEGGFKMSILLHKMDLKREEGSKLELSTWFMDDPPSAGHGQSLLSAIVKTTAIAIP